MKQEYDATENATDPMSRSSTWSEAECDLVLDALDALAGGRAPLSEGPVLSLACELFGAEALESSQTDGDGQACLALDATRAAGLLEALDKLAYVAWPHPPQPPQPQPPPSSIDASLPSDTALDIQVPETIQHASADLGGEHPERGRGAVAFSPASASAAATDAIVDSPAATAGEAGAPLVSSKHTMLETLKAVCLELDESILEALDHGYIRLLRTSWLVQQPDDYCIERRQVLEERERKGESPLLSASEAVTLIKAGQREVGVLSYRWLCPGSPDPAGARLAVVKPALQQLSYLVGLFWGAHAMPTAPQEAR